MAGMAGSKEFQVWFCNLTGCASGISDVSLTVTVSAESEPEAKILAISRACEISDSTGLPPHGIRLSENELKRLAYVLPRET
jgi:hypothetical protein